MTENALWLILYDTGDSDLGRLNRNAKDLMQIYNRLSAN